MSEDDSVSLGNNDGDDLLAAIKKAFKGGKPVNILIVGKYNVGKSTLINSLFYREGEPYRRVAEEAERFQPMTGEITPYILEICEGLVFHLYDSPGFQDGTNNDTTYLDKIRSKCPKIHLIIFCTKLNDPFRPEDKKAFKHFYERFSGNVTENMIIALTHSDQVRSSDPTIEDNAHFENVLSSKLNELEEHFKTFLEPDQASLLRSRALPTATARTLQLPGISDWRNEFWKGCITAASKGSLLRLAWKAVLKKYGYIVAAGAAVTAITVVRALR